MDFTVRADKTVKRKESEKIDKYFDVTIELEKLWNMKKTIIPIVFGTLEKTLWELKI